MSSDQFSRREIDLALGAYMGIRRCTQREALQAIVGAAHATGIGLGGVSHALIAVITGDTTTAPSPAIDHWTSVLRL
ncbi:ANTAR domain-containing protein [Mycobacterium sp. LTG2003]